MMTVRVVVRGRVQGVGYRAWTEAEASARYLNGWVRNRRDGAVEAVFSGDDTKVGDMLHVMRQGPSAAQVTAIDVSAWTERVSRGFETRPTE